MQSININNISKFDAIITIVFNSKKTIESSISTVRDSLSVQTKSDTVAIGNKATDLIQKEADHKDLISTLPKDDPDKSADPAQPSLFWGDSDGNPVALTGNPEIFLIGRQKLYTVFYANGEWSLKTQNPTELR